MVAYPATCRASRCSLGLIARRGVSVRNGYWDTNAGNPPGSAPAFTTAPHFDLYGYSDRNELTDSTRYNGPEPANPAPADHDPAGDFGYAYDAIGNRDTYAAANPFRFSTKYLDAEITYATGPAGLYYYGYRYYSPRLGRWMSGAARRERGSALLRALTKHSTFPTILHSSANNSTSASEQTPALADHSLSRVSPRTARYGFPGRMSTFYNLVIWALLSPDASFSVSAVPGNRYSSFSSSPVLFADATGSPTSLDIHTRYTRPICVKTCYDWYPWPFRRVVGMSACINLGKKCKNNCHHICLVSQYCDTISGAGGGGWAGDSMVVWKTRRYICGCQPDGRFIGSAP